MGFLEWVFCVYQKSSFFQRYKNIYLFITSACFDKQHLSVGAKQIYTNAGLARNLSKAEMSLIHNHNARPKSGWLGNGLGQASNQGTPTMLHDLSHFRRSAESRKEKTEFCGIAKRKKRNSAELENEKRNSAEWKNKKRNSAETKNKSADSF